jgi:PTH2 family peptidyl-tRNA hydrolase
MKQEFGTEDIKMVFIVRNDLSMGKGKIGAQCGHATIGVYSKTKLWAKHCRYWLQIIKKWSNEGQKKICLKVNSQPEM